MSFSRFGFAHLMMLGFFTLIVGRGTMLAYQSDMWEAKAQTASKDITEIIEKRPEKADKDIENKLTTPEELPDTHQNYNPFALKKVQEAVVKGVEDICVTGPILEAAKERLLYLDKREKQVAEQEKLLEISDRRVREQVAKLKLIKDEIVEKSQLADSKIAKESKRLISIYEKMKPKEAAGIFNEMSPAVAAELLRSMREDQSSAILAKMSPKIAYEVTLALAGNIKDTRRNYEKLR